MPSRRSTSAVCPARCEGCAEESLEILPASATLRGAPLAFYSALAFLLPLFSAVTGAWWASPSPQYQLAGGVTGLLVGMLIVRVVAAARARVERRAQ